MKLSAVLFIYLIIVKSRAIDDTHRWTKCAVLWSFFCLLSGIIYFMTSIYCNYNLGR